MPTEWPTSPISYTIFAYKREKELIETLLSLQIGLINRQERAKCFVSLHVRNYTHRDNVRSILEQIRFCDLEILEDDISNIDPSKMKPKEELFNEHWKWTLEQLFEVRGIENDIIFVEDDTPLSPDHRHYAFFASQAKAKPHKFPPKFHLALNSIGYVAMTEVYNKVMPGAQSHLVALRPSGTFTGQSYMFNSSFYNSIKSHWDQILSTDYRGVKNLFAGLTMLRKSGFPPGQILPTFPRCWHTGNESSIHGENYDVNSKKNHIWNTNEKSPWVELKYQLGKCSESQCTFKFQNPS